MAKPSDTVSFAQIGIDEQARRKLNGDLRGARNSTMLAAIGNPRSSYDSECRSPTNRRIANLMTTSDVGPFRATGLKVAVRSLTAIMSEIKAAHPEIHDAMSSAGMLCCRLVRGSSSAISNHSWGTAIDIKLDGKLDRRGDGRTQRGLLEVHPIFNKHQWFWGAAFRTEDAMHFEASDQLIKQWQADGEFGAVTGNADNGLVDFGDRGPEVEEVQERLNFALGMDLEVDGIFGKGTRAVVMEFQRENGLTVDGIVGPKTMKELKKATKDHDL